MPMEIKERILPIFGILPVLPLFFAADARHRDTMAQAIPEIQIDSREDVISFIP